MSEHLPECLVPDFERGFWVCICKNLRACEERVRREEQQRIETALTFVGQHDAAWELAVRDKTLRDAREAVAALGNEPQPKHDVDPYSWSEGFVNAQEQALAAIDALRKDQP